MLVKSCVCKCFHACVWISVCVGWCACVTIAEGNQHRCSRRGSFWGGWEGQVCVWWLLLFLYICFWSVQFSLNLKCCSNEMLLNHFKTYFTWWWVKKIQIDEATVCVCVCVVCTVYVFVLADRCFIAAEKHTKQPNINTVFLIHSCVCLGACCWCVSGVSWESKVFQLC